MNDIYVFDNDFNLQGIIDEYVSVIWRPSYYDVGDFELYLGATNKAIDLLRENRYVVRSSDISMNDINEERIDTIQTPNGLAGIKTSSNGNYTDENGQQWVCDEIVKYDDGSGEYIQRIKKLAVSPENYPSDMSQYTGIKDNHTNYRISVGNCKKSGVLLCNIMPLKKGMIWSSDVLGCDPLWDKSIDFTMPYNLLGITKDATLDERVSAMRRYIASNSIVFYYELATPIRTPLTAEQITEIEKICTFYPTAIISNDSDCDMSVKYVDYDGVKKSISGKNINLTNLKVTSFSLYGKLDQNGVPTPTNPIEIKVSGSNGSVKVKSIINGTVPTYKNVMIIKNLQLTTDIENGDYYCVTGRELKYILHQRIVWSQTTLKGIAEDAIRLLVNENAITPTDTKRIIPNLMLGMSSGLTGTIDKQVTGKQLDEVISEICKTYNYGWDIYVVNKKLTLVVYAGVDRSYEQTERPYVIFSDTFENLYNTEYQLFTETYANTTLVGGEGEGIDRIFVTVNNDTTGLNRYEVFTDARDVSQNKGTNEEITLENYNKLIAQRGKENLLTLTKIEGFTGEVLSDVAFKYGTDFFMGDLVTVINKYGIRKNVRVLSAIESEDETGKKLLPQFNL